MVEIALYLVLGLMVIGSIVAVEAKDLLSSVVAVGIVGYGLCAVFLFLGAPDLAITQAVVEVISLVVLLRATVTRDDTTIEKHSDLFPIGAALVFFGAFLAAATVVFQGLPPFGAPPLDRVSQEYVVHGFAQNRAANIVSSIILDYRAYDTLGEATVIFTAITGALAILKGRGKVAP